MQVQSTYAFNVDIDPIAVWRSFTGVVRVNVVCAEWVALLPDVVDSCLLVAFYGSFPCNQKLLI